MKRVLPNIDPSKTKAWRALKSHQQKARQFDLRTLFENDPERVKQLSQELVGLRYDFSKNLVTVETVQLLRDLAVECRVQEGIDAMFSGAPINETEGRALLHPALRNTSNAAYTVDGSNVTAEVNDSLKRLKGFSADILEGKLLGATGKTFKHVVHIGIGGSDLGPRMVVEALQPWKTHLDVQFVSNVDASDIKPKLEKLDAERTLFIIASKSFTTQETMTNAKSARNWFVSKLGTQSAVADHFVALSTNLEAAGEFGINSDRIFKFWDWVGGRFSVWSAIGLPVMLAVGPKIFDEFLAGAESIDQHLKDKGVESIPGTMALLGIWYTNFFERPTQAILPYSELLRSFPAFLQQCEMESNGKSCSRGASPLSYETVGVIWGQAGTNGQHAFYQQLHQGTRWTPCDFIAYATPVWGESDHHNKLLANAIAQAQALMNGKDADEVRSELEQSGWSQGEIEEQLGYRVFEGNRPSSLLLFDQWNAKRLGMLIAMYEHKVFIQGLIWNIYSFDQWGVELGKALAKPVLESLSVNESKDSKFDLSTQEIIEWIKNNR